MRAHRMLRQVYRIAVFFVVGHVYGQNTSEISRIAASQGGASPLLFEVNQDIEQDFLYSGFSDERECTVRRGIPNSIEKIKKGEEVTIAFMGGSITQANYCYRLQIASILEKQYPDVRFKWINAGVSGTGTDLGAFRVEEHVLSQKPDLVLLEFAVNGAYTMGMEGIVRQIIKKSPNTDICLIYAMLGAHLKSYQEGRIPSSVQGLEELAEHYQLPSIHLGMEIADLESKQRLLWKGTKSEAGIRILFSNDGIHPIREGGNLYAAALARGFEKMANTIKVAQVKIPEPLLSSSWDRAGMYEPQIIGHFDAAWKCQPTAGSSLRAFTGWFESVMTASKPYAAFNFSFEGDLFGLFDIGGPEVGQLEIWVDGKRVNLKKDRFEGLSIYNVEESKGDSLLNRFNQYCNNRYRGQYDVLRLPYGVHNIRMVVSENQCDKANILGEQNQEDVRLNPEKYNQVTIYLGRILLRGRPIINNRHI